MTRENKLALVVGFGLILFVGILISDHFSIARNQASANLIGTVSDPLVMAANSGEQGLIDLRPQQLPEPQPLYAQAPVRPIGGHAMDAAQISTNPHAYVGAGAASGIVEQPRPEQFNNIDPRVDLRSVTPIGRDHVVTMGGSSTPGEIVALDAAPGAFQQPAAGEALPGFVAVTGETEVNITDIKFHDVRPGESLYAIAKQHYGDTSLMKALATFNKMDDPSQLRAGRRLAIPPAETLGGTPTVRAASVAAKPPAKPQTYTVRPGDSLSAIAQKHLGSRDKWRKLHEINRNVIDDPDNLKVGTIIRLG